MNQVNCWIGKVVFASVICILPFGFAQASANPSSPEVIKGISWLQGQIQSTGVLANEATSIATPFQNRSEAQQALKLLATAPTALTDQLALNTEDNTEYLARRIVALILDGRDASLLITQLQARQNSDGGFGGSNGLDSDALDTAWTMLALSQSSLSNSSTIQSARDFLFSTIQADGGVAGENAIERINVSALTLLALQISPASASTATALKKLSSWLLIQQGVDGSWQNDSYLTSIALLSISSLVSDPVVRTTARSFLTTQQGVDGSWGGDPFLTSIVLRALSFEPATPPALMSSIVGKVFDNQTSTALANASITLSGMTSASSITATEGQITFSNLTAGSYTLQISKAGYTTVTNNYQLNAAQSLDIGSIALYQVSTGGIVRGQVVAASSGAPLSGVAVILNGGAANSVTDAKGNYEFAGVAAGVVNISVALPGYLTVTGAGVVVAGQALVFSPALYATGATQSTTGQFMGKVVAAGGGGGLAGVNIQLNGISMGVTAGDGSFNITLPLTSYVATFSIAGYDSATTTFLIAAGSVVNAGVITLSPQLANSSIKGVVKDQVSGQPVNGAQVQLLTGEVVTTGIDGFYSFSNLSGTSINLRASATGYLTQSWQLQISRASSIVQDLAMQAQAGADLHLSQPSVNPSSSASRTDINISLTVSNETASTSTGWATDIMPGLGAVTADEACRSSFQQFAINNGWIQKYGSAHASGWDYTNFVGNEAGGNCVATYWYPQSAPPGPPVTGDTIVFAGAYIAGTSISAVLTMQVLNAQGEVVGNATAYDGTGTNILGQFVVSPAQKLPVLFRWNTAQFPAGVYSLIARLVEAGSISRTSPLGRVMAEAQGTLTITAEQHFSGSITANPPVMQINTNTPVQLSAVVINDGNAELPAQTYQLQVIDNKTGTVLASQQVSGDSLVRNAMQDLTFANWLPAVGGGNFRLELQAIGAPTLGKIVGKVYVGDAATAAFTVNKLVVPSGTQSVKGSIKVTGQDATQGTISDPLAPLIKTAIQKAVTYNDEQASNWYTNNRCLGCHVVSQALVGGEVNRSITTFNATQRKMLFKALTSHQYNDGSVDGNRIETFLGLWALNSWHNKSEILEPSMNAAKYLLGTQNVDGSWPNDYPYGWWGTQTINTGLTIKSLLEVDELVKQTPVSALPLDFGFTSHASAFSVSGSHKGAAGDAVGNIYLTSYSGGSLTLIKPDGTKQTLLSGVTGPRTPAFGSDGALYIPCDGGVIKYMLSSGQKTIVSTNGATNVALGPDGNIYAANYWNHKITKITPAGVVSDYIVGGALLSPHGIAFDQTGALLVANVGTSQILKYAAGKTTLPTEVAKVYALSLVQAGSDMFVASGWNGVIRYDSAWQQRGVFNQGNYSWSLAKMPDGKILVGDYSSNLWVAPGTPMQLPTLGAAITKGTDWLLVDTNITTSNNLDLAHRLIGLGSAQRYFAGTAKAATIQAKMEQVAATLKERQKVDGGWSWTTGHSVSDSMVTAQVGFALDYLHPSPKDSVVQNAIKLLLERQQPDGSWMSENGILTTRLAATTWVAIWLPIALDRIGGIDTELTVSMPANVTLSNPTLAPTSSATNAIGGTDYVWKMQGVTAAGRDINFDLSLANMTLGENRPVAAESYLTFNNSFTQAQVKAPVTVPRVSASAFLNLGVTTDKIGYGANSPVSITAAVNNTSSDPLDGSVKLEIFDANNFRTAVVGTLPFIGLAAGEQQSLNAMWDSGSTAVGGYYVQATLYDAQNREVGAAKSVFNLVPSGIGGIPGISGIAAQVSLDKPSYLPLDALHISGRITNLLQNQSQSDLQTVVTLFKPDGTVFWTQTTPLPQLAIGGFAELGYGTQLGAAAAGQYRVTLSVQSTLTGLEVTASQTYFDVQSSADTGSGLKGRISVLPKTVPQTDTVILDSVIDNLGNADITALPVIVRIVEPVSQQVMSQRNHSANIIVGQPFQIAVTWDTSTATVGTTYVAVLTAMAGGKEITLAQDNFTVTEPPVKLDIVQSTARQSRVLVWLACATEEQGREDKHDGDKARENDKNHGTQATASPAPGGKAGVQCTRPVVPKCIQKRSAFLQGLLTSYNVPYLITSTRDDFRKAFREGRYNTYWLSGAVKTEDEGDILKEVREAVYRGDTLILDGEKSQHSEILQEVAGLEYRGNLSAKNNPVTTGGLMFSTAHIQTLGKANKLRPTSGIVQALFDQPAPGREHDAHDDHDGHDEHQDEHAKAPAPQPAIIGNAYGRGQALAFGFDLVNNLQNGPGLAAWNNLLLTGLTDLMPPLPDKYSGGGYVTFNTQIQNLAKATELLVTAHLPTGSTLLTTAPAATLDANGQPVWDFILPLATSKALQLSMRLPSLSGTYALPVTVDSIRNGTSKRYGEYSYSWTVSGGDQLLNQVTGDLKLQALTDKGERKARDKAVSQLQKATNFIARKQYAEAQDALLEAVEQLREIRSVDVSAYRLSLDRLLQETGWNWLRAAGL